VWILVKQLFGKTGVFLHHIVQAICFRKPVENLNSCQTIVQQKRLIFLTSNMFQKVFGSKQFVKHLTVRIKNFVWHFTGNKCIQIADTCSLFLLHKWLLPKCKKKSQKACKFLANCLYNRQKFYWHKPSAQKCLCRPIADLTQTIGLSGIYFN
jgi:lipopolysaccharide biosynthesis regulator YciM